jgi:acyl-CoA reductase-like NAD-dependent aldehyde dehydrogenase
MEPVLLADCRDAMPVFSRDLFAPVLAVSPVRSMEEAVRRANDSPYALTASVWTTSPRRGRDLARSLRGGVVSINEVLLLGAEPDVPFGGSGASGYGRTRGAAGLREMTQPRVMEGSPPAWLPRMHLEPYQEATLDIVRAAAARAGAATRTTHLQSLRSLAAAVRRYRR